VTPRVGQTTQDEDEADAPAMRHHRFQQRGDAASLGWWEARIDDENNIKTADVAAVDGLIGVCHGSKRSG
jgi:hypothetical protein